MWAAQNSRWFVVENTNAQYLGITEEKKISHNIWIHSITVFYEKYHVYNKDPATNESLYF